MADAARSRLERWAWGLSIAALAVSGFAQMPIFKRYYIADVPGLAWTADYLFTYKLHFAAAFVLLFVLGLRLARRIRSGGSGGSLYGVVRSWVLAALVATGYMRAVMNLEAVVYGVWTIRLTTWTHLGLAMVFLLILLRRVREPKPKAA